jgi:hypothetical protein
MPSTIRAAIPSSMTGLEADPRELDTFVQALFRYADPGAFVSWRAFSDDRKDAPPVFIESSHVVDGNLDHLVEAATSASSGGSCRGTPRWRSRRHAGADSWCQRL